jgi:sec-independent protein translocase protein TatA
LSNITPARIVLKKIRSTKMFGIGMPELMIILVIILLIFGAGKLPDIGSSLGRAIKGFKTAVDGSEKEQDDTPEEKSIKNTKK